MTKTQRQKIERAIGTGTPLEKYQSLHNASRTGEIKDEENPVFMFGMISSSTLELIAQGKIDPVWFAKKELANRGQNLKGQWVGFDRAEIENFSN